MPSYLRSLDFFRDSYEPRLAHLKDEREHGGKVVGTFCLYVPDEIIFAAGEGAKAALEAYAWVTQR